MTTTPIVWRCDVCKCPVANGKGYITCDTATARSACRAEQAEQVRLARADDDMLAPIDWTTVRTLARWKVLHRSCDPYPDRADYCIDVERARTLTDMLDWNAHLWRKDWMSHTDWGRWLQAALA